MDNGWEIGAVVADRWEVFGGAEGGMGRVYFVRDRAWDGMELVVKSFRTGGRDPAAVELARAQFRNEARVWLDLGAHPNIVSGFYMLELDGVLRFFMEYVPGDTLASRLASAGSMPIAEVLDVGVQLARGLDFVHARGIAHRDIKPANCLVMEDGALRIADFGLAGSRGASADAVAGTPIYMAPEQWRSLDDAGPPADVYATGIVLHELVSGTPPFGTNREAWDRLRDVPELVAKIIAGPAPVPSLVLRMLHERVPPPPLDAPSALTTLVARCLAKDPADRPTAAALSDALHALYERVVGRYPRGRPSALAPSVVGENNRAVSYVEMGDESKAITILDGILARDPTALYPWLNRAALALADGSLDPADAADRLERVVLAAHPQHAADAEIIELRERIAGYFLLHAAPVIDLATDRERLATLTEAGELACWDRAGNRLWAIGGLGGAAVAMSPGLVFVGETDRLVAFDANQRSIEVPLPAPVSALTGRLDGAAVAIGDVDGGIAVWAPDGGLRRLRGLADPIRGLALCETTACVAAGSLDGGMVVWGSYAGAPSFRDPEPCAACYVDGPWRIAIAGGADGSIRIWDIVKGTLLARLAGHPRAISGLAFASDGRLVSAGTDGTVRTWDVRTGRQLGAHQIHAGPIRALAMQPGDLVATGGQDHVVKRISLRAPAERSDALRTMPARLVVRKDMPVLERVELEARRDDAVAAMDRAELDALDRARGLRAAYSELATDQRLLTAEHACGASLGIPLGLRGVFTRWSRELPAPATHVAAHPSAPMFAVACGGHVQVWSGLGELLLTLVASGVSALAWTPDGGELVMSTSDNRLRKSSFPDGQVTWDVEARPTSISAIAASPSVLATAGWKRGFGSQGAVLLWGAGIEVFGGSEMRSVAISPADPTIVVAGRDDGAFTFVHTRYNATRAIGSSPITALAFTADGLRLIVVDQLGGWTAWPAPFEEPLVSGRHTRGVTGIAVLTRRLFATAGNDGVVNVWDAVRGVQVGRAVGHTGPAYAAVLPSRRVIVTAGADRTLHAWELDYDWLTGTAFVDDARAALRAAPSRAWRGDAHRLLAAADIWREVEAASRLAERCAGGVAAIRDAVQVAIASSRAETAGRAAVYFARTSLEGAA